MPPSPLPDLFQALTTAGIETRVDPVTRLLYSTDASIYQVEPLGVAFPRVPDELNAILELSCCLGVPVLPRGAGSSLAGQAIGPALILDCSRYLYHLIAIDPEARTATAEPGLVLNALNRAAAQHGLQFGPDPASAERATLGGSLANNASGAHSILYGMCADHLLAVELVLADGSLASFGEVSLEEANRNAHSETLESQIYQAALDIRARYGEAIHTRWPRTWRRASGYSLNYLLPWSSTQPPAWGEGLEARRKGMGPRGEEQFSPPYPLIPPGKLNLAPLVCGSEGTLAIIRKATVGLVPLPKHTVLSVLAFESIATACDAVPELLTYRPAAVELIPQELLVLARSVPAYAAQLAFINQLSDDRGNPPAALLVVEFSGEQPERLVELARRVGEVSGSHGKVLIAAAPVEQRQVWGVRKMGLGILMSRPGEVKPWSFIEDLAVPVEHLGEFVREMDRLLAAFNTRAEIYAHASAGCLHIRPLLNLKNLQGVSDLRSIAAAAVELTLRLGGSVSGEHGDGLARSEWLEQMYGKELTRAFRELKHAADPHNLLNPGKIVTVDGPPIPAMDTQLRFGADYHTQAWIPALDFTSQAGLGGAVEQCNGAGVCRKADGVMCPSFQATQEEMHSTRGRANLLRALISGRFPAGMQAEKAVYEALDLCLACKGCKAECPSAVDMAKLKYEFLNHYYQDHSHKLRDYLFGYIGSLAPLGSPLAPLVNAMLGSAWVRRLASRSVGLAFERPFPRFSTQALGRRVNWHATPPEVPIQEDVLFLVDAFTEYFYPEAGEAAVQVLSAAGCRVRRLPVLGAGRTLISKGFLGAARRHAQSLVRAIAKLDPEGRMAVVGVEPSEIYTLRDEYFDLLPGDKRVPVLADRAWMVDEFLVRSRDQKKAGDLRIANIGLSNSKVPITSNPNPGPHVLLHGHCYQKARPPAEDGAPTGVDATVAMLQAVGYRVKVVASGCCGMAGAFGYEAEHYPLSQAIGELALLPAVRAAPPDTLIAASGVSCQAQIEDGAGRTGLHPIRLVAMQLGR